MNLKVLVASDLHAYTTRKPAPSFIEANVHDKPTSQHPLLALAALIDERQLVADYLICPGDLCDRADVPAAQYAWTQLESLSTKLKTRRFFGVTGNHDLDSRYLRPETQDPKEALRAMRPSYPVPDPVPGSQSLNQAYWLDHFAIMKEDGIRTLLLDTCATHGMNPKEIDHGRITPSTLERLKQSLSNDSNEYSINLAICHHHPQQQAELEDDYDFMREGQLFLELLGSGQFGNWLVIHGHRHNPKLTYAAGGNTSPIVFSAGSLSVYLGPAQYGSMHNTFHIIDIEPGHDRSTLRGQVETFEFAFGHGWRPASADSSSMPFKTGFGFRGDLYELAEAASREVDGTLPFTELLAQVPMLKYLLPSDRTNLLALLRKRFHVHSAYDDALEELVFYRRAVV